MERKSRRLITALSAWLVTAALAVPAWGGVFGEVVAIGGHASDIALDEARGVLYIANFTANRIDVVPLESRRVETSMSVAPQPSSIALSPDGRYLVVTHFGNFEPPASGTNALTVIDLETRGKQTYALGSPALGVAFGRSSRALVVTTTDFLLFDPVSGVIDSLGTIPELAATSLPAPPPNFPPQIIATSLNVSGDGTKIYGLTDTFEFAYDVVSGWLRILNYTSSPPQGPRVVSVNHDGSKYLAGWTLHGMNIWNPGVGVWNLAQFPDAEGLLHVGSHAIDDTRRVVYAQVTTAATANEKNRPAILQVLRSDNLAVLERLRLPENLAGKSILNSDRSMMYSISDSGVMFLPIGDLDRLPRLRADRKQLLFEGSFCDRSVQTQEFRLFDPSGGQTDFSLTVNAPGVVVRPVNGRTPAVITVEVDPAAFQLVSGTAEVVIEVASAASISIPDPVRVLVHTPEPDQRGTVVSVPGKLVDVLADPTRDRFYILRQDTNEVLVFDGASYRQIAALPTGNTPTQMAITFDRRWLLVGHDNSQYVAVYDLETLQPSMPIMTPGGHYPRSVAASGNAILTANRDADGVHGIDRVDLFSRRAVELPSLGVYANEIDDQTVMVASPNGATILIAMANGQVMLYDANADTFTISRQDTDELSGAYAASAFGQYVVGDRLLNASLVTTAIMETGTGAPSGFAFVDDMGIRTTAPDVSSPGVIQRVDIQTGQGTGATRMAEAPLLGDEAFPFTRTLAALYSRQVIISLTRSGFTVLPWNYDASVAPPKIGAVVNAADYQEPVAPGGLISIFGEDLSPTNEATSQIPLPTALGNSCLTVNGVPVPVLFVSPTQINAQLPFEVMGETTLILRTPGGVSDSYRLTIQPAAPAVFSLGVPGTTKVYPTIVRAKNGQIVTDANPIHREETITIYLTGLGATNPFVKEGTPAPADPLAETLIPVEVHIGPTGLPVSFAGLAPGQVGVYQINAYVPWWTPKGERQPLVISQGSTTTTVYVRVVE